METALGALNAFLRPRGEGRLAGGEDKVLDRFRLNLPKDSSPEELFELLIRELGVCSNLLGRIKKEYDNILGCSKVSFDESPFPLPCPPILTTSKPTPTPSGSSPATSPTAPRVEHTSSTSVESKPRVVKQTFKRGASLKTSKLDSLLGDVDWDRIQDISKNLGGVVDVIPYYTQAFQRISVEIAKYMPEHGSLLLKVWKGHLELLLLIVTKVKKETSVEERRRELEDETGKLTRKVGSSRARLQQAQDEIDKLEINRENLSVRVKEVTESLENLIETERHLLQEQQEVDHDLDEATAMHQNEEEELRELLEEEAELEQQLEAMEPKLVETRSSEAVEIKEPEAVETKESETVETTELETVETTESEAMESMEPEATEAIEPEATEAIEPEATETIEPETVKLKESDSSMSSSSEDSSEDEQEKSLTKQEPKAIMGRQLSGVSGTDSESGGLFSSQASSSSSDFSDGGDNLFFTDMLTSTKQLGTVGNGTETESEGDNEEQDDFGAAVEMKDDKAEEVQAELSKLNEEIENVEKRAQKQREKRRREKEAERMSRMIKSSDLRRVKNLYLEVCALTERIEKKATLKRELSNHVTVAHVAAWDNADNAPFSLDASFQKKKKKTKKRSNTPKLKLPKCFTKAYFQPSRVDELFAENEFKLYTLANTRSALNFLRKMFSIARSTEAYDMKRDDWFAHMVRGIFEDEYGLVELGDVELCCFLQAVHGFKHQDVGIYMFSMMCESPVPNALINSYFDVYDRLVFEGQDIVECNNGLLYTTLEQAQRDIGDIAPDIHSLLDFGVISCQMSNNDTMIGVDDIMMLMFENNIITEEAADLLDTYLSLKNI